MKQIELTNSQKTKLVKMCQKLFPEYKHIKKTGNGGIWFHHADKGQPDTSNPPNYLPGFLFGFHSNGEDGDTYDGAAFAIHWFEFCIEHLLSKLNLSYYSYTRWCNEEGKTHIIDYCYSYFKDLKKK